MKFNNGVVVGIIFWLHPFVTYARGGEYVQSVKLVDVLKNPKIFDGKKVQIIGEIEMQFEKNILRVIYCNNVLIPEKDQEIWVELSKGSVEKNRISNYNKVKVIGTFDAKKKGHLGAYPGTLKIEKIEKVDSRDISDLCK